jgi:uncharacterized protein
MGFVQRRILKSVLTVVHHPRIALVCIFVSVAICSIAALTRLTISTDQNKLFSSKPWFFHDYLEYIKRFRENEAIYIVIEPADSGANPPVARWTATADAVTNRLRSMSEVVAAYCRVPIDQLGRQAILFDDPRKLPADLAGAKQLGQLALIWGAKPSVLIGALGRTPIERQLAGAALRPDPQTAGFVALLADSWDKAILDPGKKLTVGNGVTDFRAVSATNPADLGYFYVPDQSDPSRHRILIQVYPVRKFESLTSVAETVDAIRKAALDAGKDFPEFQIGVTGRPTLEADQMQTTDVDSHRAEVIALTFVFIGMAIMLRSIWLAIVAEIALGIGIGWTFGWATASIGQLNLLSLVFMIALIGIGMDYLVQILTRYRLEARRYTRPTAIWVRVFRYVGPPINTACLGAAGAFFVAVFTDFRGAAELGVIAGPGLILCLLAGYTVLPAMLTIFPPKLKPYEASERYKPARRSGAGWLALPAVWGVLLLIGAPYMPRAHFDPGLIKLQVPTLPSVKLIRTLQTWVAVVLSSDTDELRKIRDTVASSPLVASTDGVIKAQDNAAWLAKHAYEVPKIEWQNPAPVRVGDLGEIATKSRNLAKVFSAEPEAAAVLKKFANDLERVTDRSAAAAQLSKWQEIFIAQVRGLLDQFTSEKLDLSAVPHELRSHYVSDDGIYALYIYPVKDLWNDADLNEFESSIESLVATVPGAPHVTGISSNVYHTTGAIHDAFFETTVYALGLIFILVLLDFRRLGPTFAAISVLAMGLPMLVALMGFTNTSWNFANFFGLPILIGAGHEYGVFMVHRYLEAKSDPRRVWRRWDVSDRALLLCGYITSMSFGFFWLLAEHQGLRSLGLVMALGTGCIYLATIMVLRPLLKWKLGAR